MALGIQMVLCLLLALMDQMGQEILTAQMDLEVHYLIQGALYFLEGQLVLVVQQNQVDQEDQEDPEVHLFLVVLAVLMDQQDLENQEIQAVQYLLMHLQNNTGI